MALLLLDPTPPHLTPHLTTGRVRPHTSLSVHPADLQPPLPRLAFLPCFANGSLPPLPSSQSKEQRSKWLWGPDSDSRWLRSAAKRWEGKRLLVRWLCESEAPLLSPKTEIKRLAFLPQRSCCVVSALPPERWDLIFFGSGSAATASSHRSSGKSVATQQQRTRVSGSDS
jgi:hypothetical protein